MADIQPPDLETRMAIIRNKAAQLGMTLPDEVVEHIANEIQSNIRQIEGVVKRLTAYNSIMHETIDLSMARRAVKDVVRDGAYIPTADVIIEESSRYYSLEPEDLRSQRRDKNISMARQVAMHLMRTLTNMSLKDIGDQFGRNHSTVLSSLTKINDLLEKDPNMKDTIRDISSNITTYHGQ